MPGVDRRRRGDSQRRGHRAPAWAGATLIAACGAACAGTPPAATGAAAGTGQSIGALRAGIVKALDASSTDVLTIRLTSSISDGGALNEQIWLSPSDPAPGQQVRRRSLVMDASGAPVQDFEVTYTMPAEPATVTGASVAIDATGAAAAAFRTTGSTIDIDYPSRSWSAQHDRSIVVATPDDLARVRAEIVSGGWTAGTRSTLAGRPAIELTWRDTASPEVTHELWVDADTYVPMREIYAYPAGSPSDGPIGTIESEYTLLAPSAANLADLSPPLPAGFTNETTAQATPGS